MADIPTAFHSIEEAAEYVLTVQYGLEARNHAFSKTRTPQGTELAAILMAQNIIPTERRNALRTAAHNEIHQQLTQHALDTIG